MATNSTTLTFPSPRSRNHDLAIYMKEAKYEFLKYLRLPVYSASTVLFPVMFYVLFGLLMGRMGNIGQVSVATYLIASYGTFGVMGASLFANGVGVASERGLGWMQVKRASPMPPFAYFFAKFVVSMIFSSAIVLLLLALGIVFGGVHIAAVAGLKLLATLVIGAIPFSAMGLAIGYFAGPNSAPAMVNLIYLPLSFASGLWVPLEILPKFIQKIATFLPPYHLAQLARQFAGGGAHGLSSTHWEYLAGFTMLCLGIARLGFQRDEKMYG
ncbi:MAG: ABC transporter permease [Terriglobales bacterium]